MEQVVHRILLYHKVLVQNVTIAPGTAKAVYLDGAGSGAAVVDAFAHLAAVDLTVDDDLIVGDNLTFSSDSCRCYLWCRW